MGKKALYGLSCIVIFLFCIYINPSANAGPVEDEVLQVEKNWCYYFNNVDLEAMSSLYLHSPKTTEYTPNQFSNGWDAVLANLKTYFDMGLGTFNWKYRDIKVSVLTDNVAIISGYHDMYEDPPSEIAPYTLLLRFTKVLQKIDGKWLIIHNNETRVETGSPTRTDVSPTS